jgi:hypothetical protein
MAQGHISLSISPNSLYLGFGIFGLFFATTWFVFANQIHFPISKLNTVVWAHREITNSKIDRVPEKLPLFPIIKILPHKRPHFAIRVF